MTRPAEEAITAAQKMTREIRTSHPIKTWEGTKNARTILVPRVTEEINIVIGKSIDPCWTCDGPPADLLRSSLPELPHPMPV